MAEQEFSPEVIQQAADEARQREFGDFMFMDPGRNRGTEQRRISRRGMTSRRTTRRQTSSSHRHTSENRRTSRKRTSRRPVMDLNCTKWRTTACGRNQTQSCWKDGNMWVFKSRNRH